jgi:hypothetical protein
LTAANLRVNDYGFPRKFEVLATDEHQPLVTRSADDPAIVARDQLRNQRHDAARVLYQAVRVGDGWIGVVVVAYSTRRE